MTKVHMAFGQVSKKHASIFRKTRKLFKNPPKTQIMHSYLLKFMCILAIEEILATQLHESWTHRAHHTCKKQGDLTSPSESLTTIVWDLPLFTKK